MSEERTLDLLEAKIEELRSLNREDGIDLSGEIERLEKKLEAMRRELYSNLSDWERVRFARHPKRPYALDYIEAVFTDFYELHGDRIVGDDPALVAGLARLDGRSVVVLGQQKGRSTEEKQLRLFGMTRPHGYRKARRALLLAERFSFPVITLIDTPGAYPGVEAEELNIGCAIAENLLTMSSLATPIVSLVIGEGGSGGALAIGVADCILMLENAIYSVISPEAAASIVWRDKERMKEAAVALNLTAPHLFERGLIDAVISEPLGGAHRDFAATTKSVRSELVRRVEDLAALPVDELVEKRYERYRNVGQFRMTSDDTV